MRQGDKFQTSFLFFKKAAANAPVPVMANINIKVPVDLKLQLKRHTGTFIFT